MLILEFILIYFLLVFVISRLFVPYLGFKQSPVPKNIPQDLQMVIAEINKKSKTDYEYLTNAYIYITNRYRGERLKSLIHWKYSFRDPFSHKTGYLPCNVHNYLLKIILVKSNRFKEENARTQTVFLNFFIHQYLKVKLDNKWIRVDPNTNYMGISFGKAAILFG